MLKDALEDGFTKVKHVVAHLCFLPRVLGHIALAGGWILGTRFRLVWPMLDTTNTPT